MSIKVIKPTTNGTRNTSVLDYSELSKVAPVNAMSVYDIVNADKVVVLKDAVAKIEEVFA